MVARRGLSAATATLTAAALSGLIAASALAAPSPAIDAYGGQALVLGRPQHPATTNAPGRSAAAKTQAGKKASAQASQRSGEAQSTSTQAGGAASAINATGGGRRSSAPPDGKFGISPSVAAARTTAAQDSSLLSTLDIVLLATGIVCLTAVALGARRLSRRAGG